MTESRDPALEQRIAAATRALLDRQQPDGHWVFELEADATIPAEYVLLRHYLAEPVDAALEAKIAVYLRRIQGAHGGWPLFHDGDFDMSASVKAYFALKMIGDSPDADHMRRAREAIRARGGAARANVFTRLMLALFGFIPWRAVPVMPVEIMLLPKWFPFHLDKISYWSRTVIVPLLVLQAQKPKARNPKGVRIDELFLEPPDTIGLAPKAPHQKWPGSCSSAPSTSCCAAIEPLFPKRTRQRAIDRAVAFVTERLNGEDGLGAIFPAMANSVMMFDVLGYPQTIRSARSPASRSRSSWSCTSTRPIASPASRRSGTPGSPATLCWRSAASAPSRKPARGSIGSSRGRFSTSSAIGRRNARTCARAAGRSNTPIRIIPTSTTPRSSPWPWTGRRGCTGGGFPRAAIARAREWIVGMQSKNGGWGAFDADNNYDYLNHIPFADHGALLDPPTEDVTARCLSMLAQLGETAATSPAVARAVDYLRGTQLAEGSWYGRWGMNYIYGTWSVLCALNAAGVDHGAPEMRKAVDWLVSIQNADGGWGEDGASYKLDYRGYERAPSTASQTAWALLGLMAAGEVDHPAVARGIDYLVRTQGQDGLWAEPRYTAVGFPRIFYLRYHGYPKFFPLWAMARYRNLKNANSAAVAYGM